MGSGLEERGEGKVKRKRASARVRATCTFVRARGGEGRRDEGDGRSQHEVSDVPQRTMVGQWCQAFETKRRGTHLPCDRPSALTLKAPLTSPIHRDGDQYIVEERRTNI